MQGMMGMERVPLKVQLIISIFIAVLIFWGGAKYQTLRLQNVNNEAAVIGASVSTDLLLPLGENRGNAASESIEQTKSTELVVHVVGAVEKPGIYTFPEGARVNEAIAQAVPLAEADLSQLNLALLLQDGKQINVPEKAKRQNTTASQVMTPQKRASGFAASTAADQIGLIDPPGAAVSGSGKININTANKDELESLSGIGPSLAERIIAYREKEGKFTTINELTKVSGIGEATLAKFKEKIFVE